jgi:predicted dehydrogenase/threonine dehydrogenase-like Zn-dependent dehydrogenase
VKQVLQSRSGDTAVREVPRPPCAPGGVLVRNLYSVISSGTERSTVELTQKSLVGKARARPDLVRQVVDTARREGISQTLGTVQRKLSEEAPIGYSSAGRVIEVGRQVAGFDVGDVVACAGGGHANHAEIVSIPRNLCAKVPDGVPPKSAAFSTIAAISLHAIRLADVELGDQVAVIGCGLVGVLAARLLSAAGASVHAVDIDSGRVAQATVSRGTKGYVVAADTSARIRANTSGFGADKVLVTAAAASNDPLLLAAEVARDRAAIVLVGAVPIDIPRAPLYGKELSFRVSRSYGPGRYDAEYEERGLDYPIGYVRWTEQRNMACFLELLASGAVAIDDLIDEVVPVAEAARGYARLTGPAEARPKGALVIEYGDARAEDDQHASAPAPNRTSVRPSPGSTIRLGLIGPGNFASKVIVPAFSEAGAHLELVGGGSGPSAAAASRDGGFSRVAESAAAVIIDQDVDVVAVCTRHGTHADLTRQALEANKHVFCEKPLALTLDELTDVLTSARRSPGLLLVGFNRRFSPFLAEAKSFLTAAGTPITAHYRVSAGRLSPDHWTHDLLDGGGRILGEMCHFVDCLAFVAGSPISSVHAVAHRNPGVPVQAADNVVATLVFENGAVGTITYSAQGAPKLGKERLEAFAGDRTAVLDDYLSLELHAAGQKPELRKTRSQDKGHRAEIRSFLHAVREGSPSPISLDELENVSAATLAVVASLRTGATISVQDLLSPPRRES